MKVAPDSYVYFKFTFNHGPPSRYPSLNALALSLWEEGGFVKTTTSSSGFLLTLWSASNSPTTILPPSPCKVALL
jgi:hypothetical protein